MTQPLPVSKGQSWIRTASAALSIDLPTRKHQLAVDTNLQRHPTMIVPIARWRIGASRLTLALLVL